MKLPSNLPLKAVIGLLVVDFLFFSTTHPARVNAAFLIVGFGLLIASLYVVVDKLLSVFKLYGLQFGKHQKRVAVFTTVVVGGLVGLQSMGELGLRDAIVAIPLAFVLYLYLSYGRPKPAPERTTAE